MLAVLAGLLLRPSSRAADTSGTSDAVSMGEFRVDPSIAVSDMAQARTFYEDKLGLSGTNGDDGSRVYRCGDGTLLHVYPSAARPHVDGDAGHLAGTRRRAGRRPAAITPA